MGNSLSRPSIGVQIQKFGKIVVQLTDEEIRADVKKIIESGNGHRIFQLLLAHFIQEVQLTDEEIRASVKKIIEKGSGGRIANLLQSPFIQEFQLTGEEIRAAVNSLIEKRHAYWILNLLEVPFTQEVQLTDEEIRATVRDAIQKEDAHMNLEFHMSYFPREVQMTDEEIRAAVRKIIEKGDGRMIYDLFKAHLTQKAELTGEEIRAAVRKTIEKEKGHEYWMFAILEDCFPKLTQMQIVAFAKAMAPNEMTPFLRDYSKKLDANRFQWIVEASSPLCIWSFWKKCPPTLSQEKRIIVSINVERHKLIAILKAVSKHPICFTLIQYLKDAPWQNLRCFLLESDG
jgi:cell pole-organizing protein PopZ